MATPLYDALVEKTRDWSNKKEASTIPNSVIEDCLKYSADEAYRKLRIPPLENSLKYTITSDNNVNQATLGFPAGEAYSIFEIPSDLTEFISIRVLPSNGSPVIEGAVFNEVTDVRTFFDRYSEKYSFYNWMWKDNTVLVHPQLPVNTVLEVYYYRRLPELDALYSVTAVNYVLGVPDVGQPYLTADPLGTALYFAGAGLAERVFNTIDEATVYGLTQPDPTVTSETFTGKEAPNWLRDSNERLLIWGALYNMGAYLYDDKMEMRFQKKFYEDVDSLNREEKYRRARGGNVQVHFNSGGLI